MDHRRLLAIATAVAAVGGLTYVAAPSVAAHGSPGQTGGRSATGAQSTERYVDSPLGNGLARLVAELNEAAAGSTPDDNGPGPDSR